MPYIPPVNRIALDAIIEGLVNRLREIKARPGDCNYVVTRIVLESLKPSEGWSYHSLSDAEIERRLLGPYEDEAIIKNGDMPCYQEPFAKHPVAHEQIYENGQYRTRCRKLELERANRINVIDVLQEGMTTKFAGRLPEDSPYLQKMAQEQAEAEQVEGIADRVPQYSYVPEEKREAFERLCKQRHENLKKLNDGLQRIIDGDTPPPAAEAACDECGPECPGCDDPGTCEPCDYEVDPADLADGLDDALNGRR
jgi:hypothetical protein